MISISKARGLNRDLERHYLKLNKPLFVLGWALYVVGRCFLVPAYGGEKKMNPIVLELKVELVKKGIASPTTGAEYGWNGFIVRQMATNQGKTSVVMINKFRFANPTNFEIFDVDQKKSIPPRSQYAATGNPGPISKSHLSLVNVKPNETVELDALFIKQDEPRSLWDAWSNHFNWKDIAYKQAQAKIKVTGHYELDQITKENYQTYYPGGNNLISDRIETTPMILDLK